MKRWHCRARAPRSPLADRGRGFASGNGSEGDEVVTHRWIAPTTVTRSRLDLVTRGARLMLPGVRCATACAGRQSR